MLFEVITWLTNCIVSIIAHAGYAGVFVLMMMESAALPIPSEVVLPFSGYLASNGTFSLSLVALMAGIGSACGSFLTYQLGKHGGESFVRKYGKYVLLTEHDLHHTIKFFNRYGLAAAFLGRFVPVIRTFVSIPAGIARVPLAPFLLYTFAGSLLWGYLLGYLGYELGPRWFELRERFHWVDYVILGLFLLLIVALIVRRVRHRHTLDQSLSKW